uniref:RNase H type-1 domain-containing protein n=2 Tax=Brassica oleracea var. oleracea TaxID=109376 RepID=A0A0D3DK62_BRAOL
MYGSFGMDQVLSPLHAEFTILVLAMKSSLQLGFTSMSFQTDCLQLVKLINDEEDWRALASEWNEFIHLLSSFTVFSISFIARECNVRADLLAKEAHLQNSIFSHVNSDIPG